MVGIEKYLFDSFLLQLQRLQFLFGMRFSWCLPPCDGANIFAEFFSLVICFVASAVQGGLLCMFVFGGAAAVFLPCLLLYCYVV